MTPLTQLLVEEVVDVVAIQQLVELLGVDSM